MAGASVVAYIIFKFQYDSINTIMAGASVVAYIIFKFQYDSINTLSCEFRQKLASPFKFQYDSINTPVFKDTFKTTGYNTYFCRPKKLNICMPYPLKLHYFQLPDSICIFASVDPLHFLHYYRSIN